MSHLCDCYFENNFAQGWISLVQRTDDYPGEMLSGGGARISIVVKVQTNFFLVIHTFSIKEFCVNELNGVRPFGSS